MASPPREPRNSPGLKASCDLCHRAKVKCIFHGSDRCMRCTKQDYVCRRSPSLPMGRTPGSTARRRHLLSARCRCECSAGPSSTSIDAETPASAPITPIAEMPPACRPGPFEFDMMPMLALDWFDTDPLAAANSTSTSSPSNASGSGSSSSSNSGSSATYCLCFSAVASAMEQLQQTAPLIPPHSRPLDAILRQNRAALLAIDKFAQCTVSHETTLLLLVYLLLHQILAGYNAAAAASSSSSPTVEATIECPQRVILLGEFEIDREEIHVLKRHFILLDLAKVPGLLDRLAERVAARDGAGYDRAGWFVQNLLKKKAEGLVKAMGM